MNKTKMILAVTGGTVGLLVLVMAYFSWSAFSAKTAAIEGDDEGTDGLETVVAKANTLSKKAVYPCAKSITEIDANRAKVEEWKVEAMKLAVRGDKTFESTRPAAFKSFLMADARRLASLPGMVSGMLVKPEFTFGPFKDYIYGGMMPTDDQIPALQRQWDDIATIVGMLAESGISELVEIKLKGAADGAAPQQQEVRGKGKAKAKRGEGDLAEQPECNTYIFSFTAKPTAFAKAVNALETSERFTVVEGFSFSRPRDAISEALGGDKKESAVATSRRGRRGAGRRGAAEEEDDSAQGKNGIITDPMLDDPLKVEMTISVYDFRSKVGAEATENTEEVAQ